MSTKDKFVAICIAGWHYNEEFYAQISQLPVAGIFVVSHRPPNLIPPYLYSYISPKQIFFEHNFGYDWGCYQQFLARKTWRNFETIFFMHDDLVIKDNSFTDRCIELLQDYAVVGNGRVSEKRDYPDTYPESYAHSSWKPPSRSFQHSAVRGSFFSTTREALQRLGKFEVFWDPLRLTSGFGNWSTRASCGKWEYILGENCFGFLAESYRESEYLLELERGGVGEIGRQVNSLRKQRQIQMIRDIARKFMSIYWKEQPVLSRILAISLLTPVIKVLSGNLTWG